MTTPSWANGNWPAGSDMDIHVRTEWPAWQQKMREERIIEPTRIDPVVPVEDKHGRCWHHPERPTVNQSRICREDYLRVLSGAAPVRQESRTQAATKPKVPTQQERADHIAQIVADASGRVSTKQLKEALGTTDVSPSVALAIEQGKIESSGNRVAPALRGFYRPGEAPLRAWSVFRAS